MIQDILKKDWPFLLLVIILIALTIYSVTSFSYGFNTAFDQAYMLLKLQEAYDGTFVTGKSQWNLLAIHMFPYLDLTNKINSFLAANILNWITIIIASITAFVLFDKRRIIMYIAVIFLIYFHNAAYEEGLSYSTMQGPILSWAVCFYILFFNCKDIKLKSILVFILGSLLCVCWFIVIPGAALVTAGAVFVIVLSSWSNKQLMLRYLSLGISGAALILLIVHFFICPLGIIVHEMKETAQFFTKACNYDSMSMILMYGFFLRDFIFMIVAIVGIYYLSTRFDNKIVGGVFYVLVSVAYVYYNNKLSTKIEIDSFMALSSLVIIPYFFSNRSRTYHIFKDPKTYYYIFLFIFPILAVAGTNTGVTGRLYLYVIPWLLMFFSLLNKEPKKQYNELLITILILFILPWNSPMGSFSPIKTTILKKELRKTNTYHFTDGNVNFAQVGLNKTQYNYFERVDSLLHRYNYVPNQSTMFAMVYDYVNIYAFDAVNVARFHAADFFPYMDVSQTSAPDFIFICQMDSTDIGKYIAEAPWGWPDDYDKYLIGCPEDLSISAWYNIPEINRRYLYCRKEK